VIFNAFSIAFLFGLRNLYRAVERLMTCFVGLMLISFAMNLIFAQPAISELLAGFIPPIGGLIGTARTAESTTGGGLDISVLGLVGTTLVITAAFNQAYLVRQKGWRQNELADGLLDARVGSVLMALITLMIMGTAAANLRGQQLENVDQVAAQLTLFGGWGRALFCLGLFSAAYSSFLVNSMIGGFIFADGLGLGSRPTDLAPKLFTTAVLLTGMSVALYVIKIKQSPVALIVAANAVTVLAAPLVAGALIWLTNRRDIMGQWRNGVGTNLAAGVGFLLMLALAWYTASEKVWPEVRDWLAK
jgi:Mn2+/Fe2+ NRAMP family transporter